jgi:hypothetical protein
MMLLAAWKREAIGNLGSHSLPSSEVQMHRLDFPFTVPLESEDALPPAYPLKEAARRLFGEPTGIAAARTGAN